MPGVDENALMWLEEDGEEESGHQEQSPEHASKLAETGGIAETEQSAAVTALEEELQRTRKELMDVRKELAAKTVQLSRKEIVVAHEKVAELAAHVSEEKDKQLSSLAAHVDHLEMVLGQKEEELEESRRMYNAQKRALREALAAAAEAEAAERQADEARARTAEAQVVEEELDRLQHELALLQARCNLEMRARDAELQSLRAELAAANANRKQAVAAAEEALTEAWQAEVARATETATSRVVELEAEVSRVRQQLEEQARHGYTMGLAGELASLNQQKVAIQREFEAFKDMATAAARQNRENAARLLEENAALKGRLAAKAFQDVQAGFKPPSKVFTALTPQTGHGPGHGSEASASGVNLLGQGGAWMEQLPAVIVRLERQRKGLVPVLIVGSVLALFLLVAVVRAAAVTRSEHRGGLCFLAHLGINVGTGCGITKLHTHSVSEAAGEELGHLLDQAPRVHDLETVAEAAAAAEAAATVGAAAHGKRVARSDGSTAGGHGGGSTHAAVGGSLQEGSLAQGAEATGGAAVGGIDAQTATLVQAATASSSASGAGLQVETGTAALPASASAQQTQQPRNGSRSSAGETTADGGGAAAATVAAAGPQAEQQGAVQASGEGDDSILAAGQGQDGVAEAAARADTGVTEVGAGLAQVMRRRAALSSAAGSGRPVRVRARRVLRHRTSDGPS